MRYFKTKFTIVWMVLLTVSKLFDTVTTQYFLIAFASLSCVLVAAIIFDKLEKKESVTKKLEYNDCFKATCGHCGLEQVPLHDEIGHDETLTNDTGTSNRQGRFECCNPECRESVLIDGYEQKNTAWGEQCDRENKNRKPLS